MTSDSIFNKFIDFSPDGIIPEDITKKLMMEYIDHLRNVRGNKDSTINTNIKFIRMAVTWAVEKGYCVKPEQLFSFRLPPRGRGVKVKLTDDEVAAMDMAYVMSDSKVEEALSVWMLQYYFRGMRISDVLQLTEKHINEDRLIYTSSKNKKDFNIKIQPEAKEILNKYRGRGKYMFSFLVWNNEPKLDLKENNLKKSAALKRATSHVNNRLKKIAKRAGITKPLTPHAARHYFAKKALDMVRRMNFENATNVSMGLLGHSDLKEHELYVKEILADDLLDDAADSIFNTGNK